MRIKLLAFIAFILFQNCSSQNCPEGINLLPMYGNQEKCKEQLEIDANFITEMDAQFPNRKQAAQSQVKAGWYYFYNKDYDTSMKRFNQAWLLDSNSYEIYWGFGNLTALKGNPKEAIEYFSMAKKHHPLLADFYISSAMAHSEVFLKEKNKVYLEEGIQDLESGLKLDSKNPKIFSMLSVFYYYANNIQQAKVYFTEAEKIDPNIIDLEYRKIIEAL